MKSSWSNKLVQGSKLYWSLPFNKDYLPCIILKHSKNLIYFNYLNENNRQLTKSCLKIGPYTIENYLSQRYKTLMFNVTVIPQ